MERRRCRRGIWAGLNQTASCSARSGCLRGRQRSKPCSSMRKWGSLTPGSAARSGWQWLLLFLVEFVHLPCAFLGRWMVRFLTYRMWWDHRWVINPDADEPQKATPGQRSLLKPLFTRWAQPLEDHLANYLSRKKIGE